MPPLRIPLGAAEGPAEEVPRLHEPVVGHATRTQAREGWKPMTTETAEAQEMKTGLRKPVARDVKGGRRIELLGSRKLKGGVIEAWEIALSTRRWYLLYRIDEVVAGKRTGAERAFGYQVSSAVKAVAALADPPPLTGWSRTSGTFRMDSDLFPQKLFAEVRKEFGEPDPDASAAAPRMPLSKEAAGDEPAVKFAAGQATETKAKRR